MGDVHPTDRRSVSVIVPVFNAARWVATAVRSALDQDETFEVILIEDGSTDDSLQMCRDLAACDVRVELLRHPDGRNHGPAASRNLGLRSARAQYVAFLDADDWYLPGRFEISTAILAARPDIDGVYEAVTVVFEDDAARAEWEGEPHAGTLVTLVGVSGDHVLPALLEGPHVFCTDGIIVRRAVFDLVGPFDETLEVGSDTAMWWKIAALYRLAAGRVDTPVAVYRRHSGSRSSPTDAHYGMASSDVAASVWRWSRERQMPAAVRAQFARALVERLISAPPSRTGWPTVVPRILRVWHGVRRQPALLLAPGLWAQVAWARWFRKPNP